ncbi:MAG: hypothetical protein E2O93_04080 [Alphaproteobacteria bacterium]|nr:MAG: hypothetical protein E2O93_04080 [Alphaproteobacteria bacterium]
MVLAALSRRDGTFQRGLRRAVEQLALLAPRMVCALTAAGFIARLIPSELIGQYLGAEAGLKAILLASALGLFIPAGPVIAFAIAAIFARSGASTAALIAFITSWSLFAAHRIFIYEIPLLGPSFLRLRIVSVAALPIIAGLIALAWAGLA